MKDLELIIAIDFSTVPGARYPEEGDFSGQEFRNDVLIPKIKEAMSNHVHLIIDLDGTAGYGTSFLEEAFGGLIRIDDYSLSVLEDLFIFKSDEDIEYINEIKGYMKDADDKKNSK